MDTNLVTEADALAWARFMHLSSETYVSVTNHWLFVPTILLVVLLLIVHATPKGRIFLSKYVWRKTGQWWSWLGKKRKAWAMERDREVQREVEQCMLLAAFYERKLDTKKWSEAEVKAAYGNACKSFSFMKMIVKARLNDAAIPLMERLQARKNLMPRDSKGKVIPVNLPKEEVPTHNDLVLIT